MVYLIAGIAIAVGVSLAALMFRKTAAGLASGRIRTATTSDHVLAVEQIQAMRGVGDERSGAWDGVDRLGGAGADHTGGAI